MEEKLTIQFEDLSSKAANEAARTLMNVLHSVEGVTVERERTSNESLDFGASLVLVLGTPTLVALAHALSKWAHRSNQTSITIVKNGRKIVIKNLESKDAPSIVAALSA
jgi:hypothetical protein